MRRTDVKRRFVSFLLRRAYSREAQLQPVRDELKHCRYNRYIVQWNRWQLARMCRCSAHWGGVEI